MPGAEVLQPCSGLRERLEALGFADDDISGLSDRLVDAVAWGTADQIEARLKSMPTPAPPMSASIRWIRSRPGRPDDAALSARPELSVGTRWLREAAGGKLAPRRVVEDGALGAPVGGVPAECSGRDGGPRPRSIECLNASPSRSATASLTSASAAATK